MEKKAAESSQGRLCGQVRHRDRTPDLSSDFSTDLSFEELRNRFDTSATTHVVRGEIASNPATHGSAMRQVVTGKVFKKCKSATFQIDGATYTIGKLLKACFSIVFRRPSLRRYEYVTYTLVGIEFDKLFTFS